MLSFKCFLALVTLANPKHTLSSQGRGLRGIHSPAKTQISQTQCTLPSGNENSRSWKRVFSNIDLFLQGDVGTPSDPAMQAPEAGATSLDQQTTTFVDAGLDDAYSVKERDFKPFEGDTQQQYDIAKFLQRPVKIYSTTWSEASTLDVTFDPWSLYFSNSFVTNKIQNFAYFSGNLKLKVTINASPFYYGTAMMTYRPLPALTNNPPTSNFLVPYSQLPHIWLEPQINTGGELTCPFYWLRSFVDLTSAGDVAELGEIRLLQYWPLLAANANATGNVTINVYAYVENPNLFGPTAKLALQGDEYGNGPISGPATALARFASMFSDTPIIGKWATATSIGASAVSAMAKLFGWSNVPIIEDVKPFKLMPFHDIPSAHISESTTKFTLDPKAEVTVDGSFIGCPNTDELSVSSLVTKESYLTSGQWTTSQVTGDLLFSSRVTPRLFASNTHLTASTQQNHTPMSMVSSMFNNWRGDIIFHFKFVASKFHRGRVRITFDPVHFISGVTDYSNVCITKIVDIGETNEFELHVPYLQALPWMYTGTASTQAQMFSTTTTVQPLQDFVNGTITVRVLNNLTAPIDAAPVGLLVLVRGAENLEFANPRDMDNLSSHLVLQGDVVEKSNPDKSRFLINWGEAIPSLRTLLRRSTFSEAIGCNSLSATDKIGYYRYDFSRFPTPTGYGQGPFTAKSVESTAQIAFAYTKMTPLAWVAACFMANRGSLRYHFQVSILTSSPPRRLTISRNINTAVASSNINQASYNTLKNSASTSKPYVAGERSLILSNSGQYVTDLSVNPGVSIECPMMTPNLFCLNKQSYWQTGASFDGQNGDNYTMLLYVSPSSSAATENSTISKYVSIGTDFNLFQFLFVPAVYWNAAYGTQ